MRYLFFDVECSNCYGGSKKLCEFGYCMCDENFQEILSDVIPMSPGRTHECRFDKAIYKRDPSFRWAFDEKYYFEQPEFPHFFDRIVKLMCQKDVICLAFSSTSDMIYIQSTCDRYNLKMPNYVCVDVQRIIDHFFGEIKQMGLDKAFRRIVSPNLPATLQEHLSRDDAKMAAMIMKAVCLSEKKNLETVLNENKDAIDNSCEFFIKQDAKSESERKRKECCEYFANEGAKYINDIVAGKYEGKKYSLSGNVKSDIERIKPIVKKAFALGLAPVTKLDDSDYFIVADEEDKKRMLDNFSHPYAGKIIDFEEFMDADYCLV
jgi:hypothetical protein